MIALIALAASAAAVGQPAPPIAAFERSLSATHLTEAADIIDDLIVKRTPLDGKPQPDPLLNALMGQLYMASNTTMAATVYLDNAPISALPAQMQAAVALDHGRALERVGRRSRALAAYREAAASATNGEQQRQAALGMARQMLPTNPGAARAIVRGIAEGSPSTDRWEAEELQAIASSLLGDHASATKLANAAWTDSAGASMTDLAPIKVATLRAGLAAAEHNTETERAMLLATDGLSLSPEAELSRQLPVCGEDGIRTTDWVIFGLVSGPFVEQQLFPIAASRSEIVPAFQDSLSVGNPIKEANGRKPLGTVFTVACRTHVDPDFVAAPSYADPLVEWFVQTGIYPARFTNEVDDEHLNKIADRTDSLSAKFGKDSALLIYPRWQTLRALVKRAAAGDAVLPGQLADLATQVSAGLRRSGAPEWLAHGIDVQSELVQVVAGDGDPQEKAATARTKMISEVEQAPFGFARQFLAAIDSRSRNENELDPGVARLIVGMNAKLPSTMTARERRAWVFTLAKAQRALQGVEVAQRTLAAAKVQPDLCLMTDDPPKLLDQHFTYKDYPTELIAGDQEGVTAFDFDLTDTGKVAAHRIIFSLPSGIFDEVSAKGLATVRYTEPRRSGKASPCRGILQPIVWRLEGDDPFAVPHFASPASGDVS